MGPPVDHDLLLTQLDAYASARRLLLVGQVLLVAFPVHALAGMWPVTVAVVLLTFVCGSLTWRKGGWSYERALENWKADPEVARRDLRFASPLIGLVRRTRRE